MHFASPIPWWAVVVVAIAIASTAFWSYRRPLVPLTTRQRALLGSLRALALAAVVFFLCRPVVELPPQADRDLVVPVLVDVSRSMAISDADGATRLDRAADIVRREILPSLSGTFTPEVYAVGDSWTPAAPDALRAEASRSSLAEALEAMRERYRGRRVPGIVLVSDGGSTGLTTIAPGGPPVIAIGVGSIDGPRDREVVALSAGEPRVDQTSIDLEATVHTRGFGRAPFQLRILGNGRLIETRSITPAADDSRATERFTVSPDPAVATVYSAEVVADPEEPIAQNNTRSVLVGPSGRKRRLLALVGAPGYEYSFLARAVGKDPGLEIDSVVRKGQNEAGQPTFLVQAGGGRAGALTAGFPDSREALYGYDGVIVANVEGDFFTRAQLTMAAEFVSVRGGGLLVLGGRSFAQRGLLGTPLEDALPVELNDRRSGLARAAFDAEGMTPVNIVALTPEGETHPAMRIGQTLQDTRKRWAALPPLAASAAVGGPRPGATVLATTTAPSGARYPVVAVQRYGRGRTMVFAGEASWRWRMLMPAADRTYEYFWRQAARWLTTAAPDPISVVVPAAAQPGDAIRIEIEARDAAHVPVPDAAVTASITAPGGQTASLAVRRDPATSASSVAAYTPAAPGLYRVQGEVRRGAKSLGGIDAWFHVGGSDREFADPRLNDGFLRRVARASGGQYLGASDAGQAGALLRAAAPQSRAPERRDLWHEPWAFAIVVLLLSMEWILRRRWGLR